MGWSMHTAIFLKLANPRANLNYVLSVKYHESVKQFEQSFLDVLVAHGIQDKVCKDFQTISCTNHF